MLFQRSSSTLPDPCGDISISPIPHTSPPSFNSFPPLKTPTPTNTPPLQNLSCDIVYDFTPEYHQLTNVTLPQTRDNDTSITSYQSDVLPWFVNTPTSAQETPKHRYVGTEKPPLVPRRLFFNGSVDNILTRYTLIDPGNRIGIYLGPCCRANLCVEADGFISMKLCEICREKTLNGK